MKKKIEQIYKDSDGWWVILMPGWSIDNCIGWREDTKKKLLERIKSAKFTKEQ